MVDGRASYSKVTEVILEGKNGTRWMKTLLLPGRQHFANPAKHVALLFSDCEKFKSVQQTDAVAHQGTKLQRIGR